MSSKGARQRGRTVCGPVGEDAAPVALETSCGLLVAVLRTGKRQKGIRRKPHTSRSGAGEVDAKLSKPSTTNKPI